MKESEINYLTEDPSLEWCKVIDASDTLEKLRDVTESWGVLTQDAYEASLRMDQESFKIFKKGLKLERSGKSSGEDWQQEYGFIILPERLFISSLLAQEFCAPWGTAYIRLKEHKWSK